MNAIFNTRTAAFLLSLLAVLTTAHADIEVVVSVKFIRNNDAANTRPGSTLPGGGIGTVASFGQEITYDNAVLDTTTRGYSLTVVEYLDITPSAPAAANASVTGITTIGSATVMCGNTAGLQTFMRVTGPGIPVNTIILSLTANSGFTMSNSATAANNSAAIVGSFPPDHWFIFSPRLDGRTYTVQSCLTLTAPWLPLGSSTQSDGGSERTVIDLNATGGRKFYRVEITKP